MALNGASYPIAIEPHVPAAAVAAFRQNIRGIQKELKTTEVTTKAATGSFKSLAGAFTGMWAGRMVVGALKSITRPAIEMQTALARLSVLAGESGMSLEQFKDKAMAVAGVTTFGPVKLTDALMRLRQVTGDTSAAMGMLRPTAQLAMASMGKINLKQAVEMMGYMVKGFGLKPEEAAVGAQRIFTASKALGVTIDSYAQVMDRLGVAASLGNQSFDELVKTFGLLSRGMSSSREAATGLQRAMMYLGTSKAQGILARSGIITTGKNKGILPIHEVVRQLSERMDRDTAGTTKQIVEALGKKGAKVGIVLVEQYKKLGGKAGWDRLSAKMLSDTEALEEASAKWLNSFEGQAELLNDALEKLAITLGTRLLPLLTDLATSARKILEGANRVASIPWIGALLGEGFKFTASIAGVWAITAAFSGLFRIISSVTVNLGAALGGLTKVFGAFGGGATILQSLALGVGAIVDSVWLLTKRLWILYAAYKAVEWIVERAKLGEAEEPARNVMARKIIASTKTTEEEKGMAKVALHAGGVRGYLANVSMTDWLRGSRRTPNFAGVGNKPWLTASSGLMDIAAEAREQVSKGMTEPATEVKAIYEEVAKIQKKAGELAVRDAKDAYGHMAMGSEEMINASKELLGKRTGLTSYVPPLIKMGAFKAMKQQLAAALGSTKEMGDITMIESALREADVAEALINKSQTPEGINPTELMQLKNALAAMGVAGSSLWRQLGPGVMSSTMLKRFDKQVAQQANEMGSERNMAWMEMRTAMRAGEAAGGYLPGYNAATGGYGPVASELWAGTLPGQHRQYVKYRRPGSFPLDEPLNEVSALEPPLREVLAPGAARGGMITPALASMLPPQFSAYMNQAFETLKGQGEAEFNQAMAARSSPTGGGGGMITPALASMLPPQFNEYMSRAFDELKKGLASEFQRALDKTLKVEVVSDRRDPMGPTGGSAGPI